MIEVDVVINHDEPAVLIAIYDEAQLSTAAGWRWGLYDTAAVGSGGTAWTPGEKDDILGQSKGANRRTLALMLDSFDLENISDAEQLTEVMPDGL